MQNPIVQQSKAVREEAQGRAAESALRHVRLRLTDEVTASCHSLRSPGIGTASGAVVEFEVSTEAITALHIAGGERQDMQLLRIALDMLRDSRKAQRRATTTTLHKIRRELNAPL